MTVENGILRRELLAQCTEVQRAALDGLTGLREGGIDETLQSHFASGLVAWPTVGLDPRAWCAHLASHLPAENLGASLDGLFAADFYLAAACVSNSPLVESTARDLLMVHYLSNLTYAIAGIRIDPELFRDAEQTVRTELLVGAEGQPPKITLYSGRGPLRAWIRVVTARVALGLVKKKGPVFVDDAAQLEEIASEGNPELEDLRHKYHEVFREAVQHAMQQLSIEERNLLRLHHIEQLSIDDLAISMNVHRATVARRVARVRESLFEATRAYLASKLLISPTEFRSLMGALLMDLDVSVQRILGAGR